ncbi:MAG: TIGR01777 family oxidoreductase, partial [Chitinophagales bacterium]
MTRLDALNLVLLINFASTFDEHFLMSQVLITGGSGLIGQRLTSLLQKEGFDVAWLTRSSEKKSGIRIYHWDLKRNFIEEEALFDTYHIIHLAGTNVAHYWTSAYKKKILSSRIETAQLIFEKLSSIKNHVKTFISASGVGFYKDGGDEWLNENSPAGNDFLSNVCQEWESAANHFRELDKRVVILRTGIVLAKDDGTLPALISPMKFGIAPIFGNGKQFYSWIHVHDLCRMYLQAIKNETMNGIYNSVAPQPIRFKELANKIASVRRKPKIDFPVPKFLLQLMLDGFGATLLSSLRCSSKKIEETGFQFQYSDLKYALDNLVGNK